MKLCKLTLVHSTLIMSVTAFGGSRVTYGTSALRNPGTDLFSGPLATTLAMPTVLPSERVERPPLQMIQQRKPTRVKVGAKRGMNGANLKLAISALMPLSFLLANSDAIPTSTVINALHSLATDSKLESVILSDLAHVAIDLFTFLTPERLLLRMASVLGRVMVMGSDYLPDHFIMPEELVFQMGMMGATTAKVIQGALETSHIPGSFDSMPFRDRCAYQKLFRPVGMSWHQFRRVVGQCVEWIDVPPNTLVVSEKRESELELGRHSVESSDKGEYLYWLYKGDAEVVVNDATMHYVDAKRGETAEGEGIGLLGDVQFSQVLEERKAKSTSKHTGKATDRDESVVAPPRYPTVRGGPNGATYMRIDTTKLLRLMDDDDELDACVQSILLKGMRSKLGAVFSQNVEFS